VWAGEAACDLASDHDGRLPLHWLPEVERERVLADGDDPCGGGGEVIGETAIGGLHNASKYEYCLNCLNWLLTRPAGMPFVNVRPTMFDVPAWSTPFMETCVSERLPWARTAARHSFAKYPGNEDYGPLMAEFAALQSDG
jgi:hypothetical protein